MKNQISISFLVETNSTRNPWNVDMHGNSVEGGALNANYTLVDAVAKISSDFGNLGLEYGKDFKFDDRSWSEDGDKIVFNVDNAKYQEALIVKVKQ